MNEYSVKFANVGTGLGKTSIILGSAAKLSKETKELVIILNSDINLLTRDFNQAVATIQPLGL